MYIRILNLRLAGSCAPVYTKEVEESQTRRRVCSIFIKKEKKSVARPLRLLCAGAPGRRNRILRGIFGRARARDGVPEGVGAEILAVMDPGLYCKRDDKLFFFLAYIGFSWRRISAAKEVKNFKMQMNE